MRLPARDFIHGEYRISSDPAHMDLEWVHRYLSQESYWAHGISTQVFQKSVDNSLCFGLFHQERQIGFGRVISDFATFVYLADVFISEKYRGQGLGKWLVETMLGYPGLQGIRRWMLVTRDAHGLYERFGFKPLKNPGYLMERVDKRSPGE